MPSSTNVPVNYQLTDDLRLPDDHDIELGLTALASWLDSSATKVDVLPGMAYGIVKSAPRYPRLEPFEQVAECPPTLVPHLRQLLFNIEKCGRLAFYFAKVIANLEPNQMPSWVTSAYDQLNIKKKKRRCAALKKNWKRAFAEFVYYQTLRLRFYLNALEMIMQELVAQREALKDDMAKWIAGGSTHVCFLEYIVRNRWEAWDTNSPNDERWSSASALNPLHPDNQAELGQSSSFQDLFY